MCAIGLRITVNAICPGYVWTPLVEKQIAETTKARGLTEAEVNQNVLLSAQPTSSAVNARSGQMRYFDSRDTALTLDHVMASGALPPAFPAVMIDGEPYWDDGIYSNTPL